MSRYRLRFVAPTLLLLAAVALPLALGRETLYLRDLLNAHYQAKVGLAAALGRGALPLVDLLRGAQPLLGNPNAVALYPDNLLLLLGVSPLWLLNAHLWLHWLLAPCAMAWLGRAWGLRPTAAWAAGVCYASSGFFISQLNLFNLVAGAALLPALVAAALDTVRLGGRRRGAALAALWALLLLAGDPQTALVGLLLAAVAVLLQARVVPPASAPWSSSRPLALAFALGTLVAAPQLVAFARILPASFRGHFGPSAGAALSQSWDPRTMAEWLLPFVFGRPDLAFWGQPFFGGHEPFLLTLYPGVLALALVAVAAMPAAGRRRAAAFWAWGSLLGGVFLALGAFNPLVRGLVAATGGSLLRYPVKLWLPAAIGASLLCGLGWSRLALGSGRRRLTWVLALAAAGYAALWQLLQHPPPALDARLRGLAPRLAGPLLAAERERWAALAFLILVLIALFLGLLWLWRRHPRLAAPAVLALHAGSQLFLLQPARDTDQAAPYRTPPPFLASVPADALVVHGRVGDLFGPSRSPLPRFPDARTLWAERQRIATLFPQGGAPWGRRYDFDPSPEGLDSFLSVALVQAFANLDDAGRVRLLEASGVEVLILDRPLDGPTSALRITPAADPGAGVHLYALPGSAPPVALLGDVRRVADVNQALRQLLDPAFDPKRTAVLPGSGPERAGRPGTVSVAEDRGGALTVDVEAPDGGVLLVQRAHLPLYRATVGGAPARVLPGNVHRLAVEVPPGRHRVRLWPDARPFRAAAVAALLALASLLAWAWPGARAQPKTSGERLPRGTA